MPFVAYKHIEALRPFQYTLVSLSSSWHNQRTPTACTGGLPAASPEISLTGMKEWQEVANRCDGIKQNITIEHQNSP